MDTRVLVLRRLNEDGDAPLEGVETGPEAGGGGTLHGLLEALARGPLVGHRLALKGHGPDVDDGGVVGGEGAEGREDLEVYAVGEAVVLKDAAHLEPLGSETACHRSFEADTAVPGDASHASYCLSASARKRS